MGATSTIRSVVARHRGHAFRAYEEGPVQDRGGLGGPTGPGEAELQSEAGFWAQYWLRNKISIASGASARAVRSRSPLRRTRPCSRLQLYDYYSLMNMGTDEPLPGARIWGICGISTTEPHEAGLQSQAGARTSGARLRGARGPPSEPISGREIVGSGCSTGPGEAELQSEAGRNRE